jgi:glycosyltransferase involved in cell wall biosynthesis
MTQKTPETRKTLRVAGCGLRGTGYPNAWNTVQLLARQQLVQLSDCACWLPDDFHLWKLAKGTLSDRLRGAWLLASSTLISSLRLAASYRRGDWLYLPYPSLPMLWLLSWLPSRLRPVCIVDAYITVWDTLFQDRQLGKKQDQLSRWLLAAESRALRVASTVIVDTRANADHLSALFGVKRQRIRTFPLAIAPASLPQQRSTPPGNSRTRILFIGTFVPLQGTTVIAKAIALLADRDDLEFILIGDGQQATEAAQWLDGVSNVTWHRGWQPAETLANELAKADICLGVFGGDGKAARVLPFKLYMAMASGKAIITQAAHGTPDSAPAIPALAAAPNPDSLASAISSLVAAPEERLRLGKNACAYYQQHLASDQLAANWRALLE